LELTFFCAWRSLNKKITVNKNAQGFVGNKQATFECGAVAGNARKSLSVKAARKSLAEKIIKNCHKIKSY
jgi:hypothetical protein